MSRDLSNRGRGRGGRGRGEFNLPFHPRGRGGGGGGRGEGRGRGDFRGGRGRGGGPPPEVEIFKQDDGRPSGPDQQVTRIENDTVFGVKKGVHSERHPTRPAYGSAGREIMLWTNYFKLASEENLELYRYNVDIKPDDRGKVPVGKKAKRIVQLLLEDHLFPHGHEIASDYRSTLISRRELQLEDEYLVAYRAEGEDEPGPNATNHRIRIQSTGSLTVSELINHLTSSQMGSIFDSKEQVIQALNIVMVHHPKSLATISTLSRNRNFDMNPDSQDKASLGGGLQVIRGFIMSVRAATSRVLVNVQVKNMAFFDDGPLERVMQAFMSQNGPNKVKLLKFVKRLSIDVTHIVRKNKQGQRIPRIKTVQGFATRDDGRKLPNPPVVPQYGAGAKEVKFFLNASPSGTSSKDSSGGSGGKKKSKKGPTAGPDPPSQGRYISVYDFFKHAYNITLKDPSLPVINVSTKDNPSYLPAEVCVVRPGQPALARLSPAQTQQMIRFAVRRPAGNAQSIVTTGGRLLGLDPTNPTLDAFGFNVTPKLLTVWGRVLNVPAVKYSGTQATTPRFGSWDMRSVKFFRTAKLPGWTYLRISLQDARSPWQSDEDFVRKVNELQGKLNELGVSVSNCMPGLHIRVNDQNLASEIEQSIHKFAVSQKRPKLILVIVPERASIAVYNQVKFSCDVNEGLLNICVLDTKFARANPQYLANVGLKVNLKAGGINHALDQSKLKCLQMKKTMIVGIDVTHPSPGSSKTAPSVAAVVASVDEHLGQWPADVRVQQARQEDVADLDAFFKPRLLVWRSKNNALPENILVYRDGVSEGQYDKVLSIELPALQKACREVYPPSSTKVGLPRISIIIVGKRHNTRFYPTKKEDADRGGNPPNGTIVDRGVTEARNWDFFLQAHAAIQGTARPAHYYVVYDQIFSNIKDLQPQYPTAADALEDVTHNMCYLFGRATKAVSVCPPAYYADLVCTRARCYLSGLFDPFSTGLSSVSGGGGGDASSVGTSTTAAATAASDTSSMVKIHPAVKDTMFYI